MNICDGLPITSPGSSACVRCEHSIKHKKNSRCATVCHDGRECKEVRSGKVLHWKDYEKLLSLETEVPVENDNYICPEAWKRPLCDKIHCHHAMRHTAIINCFDIENRDCGISCIPDQDYDTVFLQHHFAELYFTEEHVA